MKPIFKAITNIKITTENQNIELPISKIVNVKSNNKSFIYFEQMEDSSFRMTYTNSMFRNIPNETEKD